MAEGSTSSTGSAVWQQPGTERGWPNKVLPFNITLRLTAGLAEAYTAVRRPKSVSPPAAQSTAADGRLVLSPTMPLIGQRYRFMHAIAESDLSQIIVAIDTYRHCAPTADGRRRPLVAIKVLNAQHWALGAQELERMRQLWHAFSARGIRPRVVQPLAHFEEGAHFCIVFPLHAQLTALSAEPVPAPRSLRASGAPLMVTPVDEARARSLASSALAHQIACPHPRVGQLVDAHRLDQPPRDTQAGGMDLALRPRLAVGTLRLAAADLLGALCALHNCSVIHADLKPENVLVTLSEGGAGGWYSGGVESSGRVLLIDFSNAMACEEAPAYHDTFEVQTLGYRAPEAVYGVPFGTSIDMWSLGVCLAELHMGRALFSAASRSELAVEIAQLLGAPPIGLYRTAKYATLTTMLGAEPVSAAERRSRLSSALAAGCLGAADVQLVDLIGQLLVYEPHRRLTAEQALRHPFFESLFPFAAVIAPPPTIEAANGTNHAAKTEPSMTSAPDSSSERGHKRKEHDGDVGQRRTSRSAV
jgi:hypothetical protein